MYKLTLAGLILVSFVSVCFAGQVPALTQMVSGQTASAADVNDNFNNIATEVNDNDLRLDNHENDVVLHSDTLLGLGCTTDQIAMHNGVSWVCSEIPSGDITPPVVTHEIPAESLEPEVRFPVTLTDDTELAYYTIYGVDSHHPPETYPVVPGQTSLTFSPLFRLNRDQDGSNEYRISALDRAGNSHTVVVDIFYTTCGNIVPYAQLDGCDFSGMDFSGYDLTGVNFTYATLVGTNFSGANLYDVRLNDANLESADLSFALFEGTNFSRTNLANATLHCARSGPGLTWLNTIYENTVCPDGSNSDDPDGDGSTCNSNANRGSECF